MSNVITIVSKNAIRDIHGLLVDLQSKMPGMLYQFGEDERKYAPGFQPDVYAWVYQKSTRYLSWYSKKVAVNNWHYEVKVNACSNCITWDLAFALIEKIAVETQGLVYNEDMNIEDEEGMDLKKFSEWKAGFYCKNIFKREVELSISISEFKGDVTIFGTHCPFTFNKNINAELQAKKSPAKEFEKRMLQLQNAYVDEAYTHAVDALITSKRDSKEYKVKFCNGIPFSLFINEEVDYIVFSKSGTEKVFLVPAKKVREVMPSNCFFDEYSFYVSNSGFAIWESILGKAALLHEEI